MATDRRGFLNFIIGGGLIGWLLAVMYPIISYLNPPKVREATVNSVKAGSAADFSPNGGQIVKFGRKPVLLVRTEEGEFRAFDGTCTHLDCIVQYRQDTKQIWCACHNGIFDLRGRNLSGPPPKPLLEYTVTVVNDEIVISKPAD